MLQLMSRVLQLDVCGGGSVFFSRKFKLLFEVLGRPSVGSGSSV